MEVRPRKRGASSRYKNSASVATIWLTIPLGRPYLGSEHRRVAVTEMGESANDVVPSESCIAAREACRVFVRAISTAG